MSVTSPWSAGGISFAGHGAPAAHAPDAPPGSALERNLAALARTSPDAAAKVRAAAPRADVRLETAEDGGLTGTLGTGEGARLLASRRRPLEEARRLAESVDLQGAAVFFVAGFGVGHHAGALARRVGTSGVVIVFEPDVGLLRAVLERADLSGVLAECNLGVLTDADDTAAMGEMLRGGEGLVGMGVTLVEHPASRARLAGEAARAMANFTGVVESVKMTVVTTLVQARVTIRNLLQNLDAYGACAGIDVLEGVAKGRPAVVVSAGPSLKRNAHLLAEPGLTDRCVVVAVQTVLRPLLEMGVRPHFVTALDYSEINRRFYEGLTPAMVEGVTLVVEPKVNPAVLEAWPGAVLCVGDRTLDLVLGEDLARQRGELKQGATVAHLAYYLARHMGCDPVGLVGQDLGFTDNQYYAAGASIHGVWGGELNAFKSLELLEWQRIARMGPHLRRATDTLGRPIYTDEQMLAYLRQFEGDFRADAQRGLRTIDATEGGVRKLGAETATLAEFLGAHARGGAGLDALLRGRAGGVTPEARRRAPAAVRERVALVRRQVGRIADLSRRTASLLTELLEHQRDLRRADAIIGKLDEKRDEVDGLRPGFTLVNLFAQTAVFNRLRADRSISLEADLEPLERQRRQAERDLENVRTLARAADDLGALLDGAAASLNGGPKVTRDLPKTQQASPDGGVKVKAQAVADAVVPVDLGRSGVLTPRSLEGPFAGHASVLSATVARLLRVPGLRSVVLAAEDPARVEALLEPAQHTGGRVSVVRVEPASPAAAARRRAVAAARLWARACWRGGLADLTAYDELLDPGALGRVLEACGATAGLLAGPDWCAVDPGLCAAVLERHAEDPATHRLAFTQAVPGLCGAVVSRELCGALASGEGWERNAFASLGGLLGYIPIAPAMDLIAHAVCVGVDPAVRDAGVRAVADTPWMRAALERATAGDADSREVCGRLGSMLHEDARIVAGPGPAEIEIELGAAPDAAVVKALRAACRVRPDVGVTLVAGAGEIERAWALSREARIARAAGVHVRVRAGGGGSQGAPELRGVLDVPVDVLSVEIPLGGDGEIDAAWAASLRAALGARAGRTGEGTLGSPWILPRLRRTDAAHGVTERFVGEFVMACGWAALDPADAQEAEARGERVRPLPPPSHAAARMARTRLTLGPEALRRVAESGIEAVWAEHLASAAPRAERAPGARP